MNKELAEKAVTFGFTLYITLSIGSITKVIGGLAAFPYLDPWTRAYLLGMDNTYYVFVVFLLLLPTFTICYKQWTYYYSPEGKKGGKQGIFQDKIRYVNNQEKYADYLLAWAGGLLFPISIFPIYWFLAFSIYCSLVIFRCVLTLNRRAYARELRKGRESVPSWYDQSLEWIHNGTHQVKQVLVGWILSNIVFVLFALSLFWFFSSTFFWNLDWILRIFIFIILDILGIAIMFWTVRLGTERLVHWYYLRKEKQKYR